MTKRERIMNAIAHKKTDFIPHQIDLGSQELEKMISYTGDKEYEKTLQNHIEVAYFDGFLAQDQERAGYFVDDFGVCWNRNCIDKDIGMIEHYQLHEIEDFQQYVFPQIREQEVRDKIEQLLENGSDAFKIVGIGFSMFERAWTLRGMEELLMDMIEEPEFVHDLLDAICNYNCKILEIALEYDIDGVYFGDDWGQQRGLIMGAKRWCEFIKPRMKRMYGMVKEKGKYVLQHSCGDIIEIFPDLIEIGLDVYQTFQPEIYCIKEVKKEFGKQLTFWGGISTQQLLPFAAPEEVKAKIIEIAAIMGTDGGYILAPTHAVPGDVPPENIKVMVEVFQNQAEYFS